MIDKIVDRILDGNKYLEVSRIKNAKYNAVCLIGRQCEIY